MHVEETARQRLQKWGFRSENITPVAEIRDHLKRRRERSQHSVVQPSKNLGKDQPAKSESLHGKRSHDSTAVSYFATHSSYGILDLGASKTVIGTAQLASLINDLEPQVRAKLQRCPCNITFRFGNEGTLTSDWPCFVMSCFVLTIRFATVSLGFAVCFTICLPCRAASAIFGCPWDLGMARMVGVSSVSNPPKEI